MWWSPAQEGGATSKPSRRPGREQILEQRKQRKKAQRELRLRDARREQIVAKRHGKPLTVRVEDRQADDAVRRGARHGCGLDAA